MKKALSVVQLVLCCALSLGMKLVFHACEPKPDGSYMHCHTAENAVCIAGAVLAMLSLIALLVKQRPIRLAAHALTAAGAVVTVFIPGTIVKMCMSETMRCYAVMRPAVIVFCALIAVCAVVGAVLTAKEQA